MQTYNESASVLYQDTFILQRVLFTYCLKLPDDVCILTRLPSMPDQHTQQRPSFVTKELSQIAAILPNLFSRVEIANADGLLSSSTYFDLFISSFRNSQISVVLANVEGAQSVAL